MTAPVLEFEDAGIVLGGARALDRVGFTLGGGERLAITGESGSGKSTVARLALALIPPTSGAVRIFGIDTREPGADGLRQLRGRCGMAMQGGSLFGELDVTDNLRLGLGPFIQATASRLQRRIDRLLLEFRLEHAASRPVAELSIGEQRRVELARAFLREPQLLVLDDPFEGAHASAIALERQVERRLARLGCALLLLTQDEHLAARMAPRVLRLEGGRLRAP